MKFLRIKQVMQLTGLSRMTIYRLELAGRFPKRRRLSENSVAWLESDIAAGEISPNVFEAVGGDNIMPSLGSTPISLSGRNRGLSVGSEHTRSSQRASLLR